MARLRDEKNFKGPRPLLRATPTFKVPCFDGAILTLMRSSSAYTGVFTETFKLIDIILAFPIGTATAERSFSQMKLGCETEYRTQICLA